MQQACSGFGAVGGSRTTASKATTSFLALPAFSVSRLQGALYASRSNADSASTVVYRPYESWAPNSDWSLTLPSKCCHVCTRPCSTGDRSLALLKAAALVDCFSATAGAAAMWRQHACCNGRAALSRTVLNDTDLVYGLALQRARRRSVQQQGAPSVQWPPAGATCACSAKRARRCA